MTWWMPVDTMLRTDIAGADELRILTSGKDIYVTAFRGLGSHTHITPMKNRDILLRLMDNQPYAYVGIDVRRDGLEESVYVRQ